MPDGRLFASVARSGGRELLVHESRRIVVIAEGISAVAGYDAGNFKAAELPDPARLPAKRKDTSYMTPGWKYQRSVSTRRDNILGRLKWQDRRQFGDRLWLGLDALDEAGVADAKARIEPQIAELRRAVAAFLASLVLGGVPVVFKLAAGGVAGGIVFLALNSVFHPEATMQAVASLRSRLSR